MWTSFEMCEELIAEVLNFACLLITYFTFFVRSVDTNDFAASIQNPLKPILK